MAQDQLQKFFQEKHEKSKPANQDWGKRRDEWIQAVENLYRTVQDEYLQSSKAEVAIAYSDRVVTEHYVGEYRIRELSLRVGDEQVIFAPKGVNIVGAKGRIDVHGDRGDGTIVWQGDDDWRIVLSRTPTLRLEPLTANSLAELLRAVMRP